MTAADIRRNVPVEVAVRPFLPAIDQITSRPLPRSMRGTLYAAVALVASLLAVAVLCHTDVVVTGRGRLVSTRPPMVLQPLEHAILRNIAVRPGDHVVAGQVVATFDPTFSLSDRGQLLARQRALRAEVARATAEREGHDYRPGPDVNAEEVLQLKLWERRRNQFLSRIDGFEDAIQRVEGSMRTAESDRVSFHRQIDITRDIEAMRAQLFDHQTGSRLNLLDSQVQRLRAERDAADNEGRLVEMTNDLAAKKAERDAFFEQWDRETLEAEVKARTDLAQVDEQLNKASLMSELATLRAPADGVVLEVMRRAGSSVVREAETVITMMPTGVPLEAEIEIAPGDIGQVRAGTAVRLKVDAFPYQRFGHLDGRLNEVSQDSFSVRAGDQGSESRPAPMSEAGFVYRAHVTLEGDRLEDMPADAALLPGMTLVAEIAVGRRRLITYFLWPIIRGFGESLREP